MSAAAASSGAPRVQDLHAGGGVPLQRLWHLAPGASLQQASSQQPQHAPAAAEYAVLAHVWPSAKVARGCVALSTALSGLLGSPQPGVVLALMAWPSQPALAAPKLPASAQSVGGPLQDARRVVLRLQAPWRSGPGGAGAAATPGGAKSQAQPPGTPAQRTPLGTG